MSSLKSNRNFIIVAAVISAIALTYGVLNFQRAFPEIAVNFTISRKTALNTARDYLIGRKFDLEGYRETIIFSYDEQAKIFMERELGIPRMTELTRDSIDVWRWEVRFFKPLEKLEYQVFVDPNGRIDGFRRQPLESEPGPSLDGEAARIMAEAFISGPAGEKLDRWELVESNAFDRQSRRDHVLVYEMKDFELEGAKYRLKVDVQGAQIGGFKRYLKVPQEWRRSFSRIRSQNMVFQNIAQLLYVAISIILFGIFIRNVRSGQIAWRPFILIGLVMAVAVAVMIINSLPLALSRYITTESYSAFMGKQIMYSLLGGIALGAFVLILLGAGERGYRRDNPERLHIPNLFSRRGLRSREFFQATLMGYILAAFHVGFVVFFYVMGGKIGFWSPADVEYDNSVSTLLPWIFPLATAMTASLTEEFWFRLFGISFFRKIFRSTAVAVILQAFLWGFLHSNYPQQPGFVRGLEVGLIGIAAGVVMLRFGIWATLTWHFVVDAVFIGLFLFRSDNPYFWVSGLIVCGGLLIPALFAAFTYLRRRTFEPVDDLLNGVVEDGYARRELIVERAELYRAKGEAEPDYQPLPIRIRRTALLVGAAGVIVALLPRAPQFGDEFSPQIDRGQAVKIAEAALNQRFALAPDSFKIGAIHSQRYSSRWEDRKSYVKKYGDREIAGRIFFSPDADECPCWRVSFKRELDPEYYFVRVDQLVGTAVINHVMPDSAHGADLTAEEARALAEEAFVEAETHPDDYRLIEATSKKLPNRRDHSLTWETIEPVVGDAHFRRTVKVLGDEVLSGKRTLKVPEEWVRHEERRGLRWTIFTVLRVLLLLGAALLALLGLRRRRKPLRIGWRTGVGFGVTVLLLGILDNWNDGGAFWFNYITSVPAASYSVMSMLSMAVQAMISALFAAVVVVAADSLVQALLMDRSWPWESGQRKAQFEDGLILTIGTVGAAFGMAWLLGSSQRWLDLPVHNFTFSLPPALDMRLPWFGNLYNSLVSGVFIGSLVMMCYVILTKGIRSGFVRALALLLAAVAAADLIAPVHGNPTAAELAWSIARSILVVIAGYLVLRFWIQGRLWVLIAACIVGTLIQRGATILSWGKTPYSGQGWLLIALALLPLLWMLWSRGRTRLNGAR